MINFDDIDLGIMGVVLIIVVVAIIAAIVELPPQFYAFGGTGLAVIGSLVRGIRKNDKSEVSPEADERINI